MLSLNPMCSISTRPAYYGTRRIAPAAATSRSEAWGARPAVEELRPARRPSASQAETHDTQRLLPVAAFAAQVIAQFDLEHGDTRAAARAYAAIDNLLYQLPKVAIASL